MGAQVEAKLMRMIVLFLAAWKWFTLRRTSHSNKIHILLFTQFAPSLIALLVAVAIPADAVVTLSKPPIQQSGMDKIY